jgi:hypothetical protein
MISQVCAALRTSGFAFAAILLYCPPDWSHESPYINPLVAAAPFRHDAGLFPDGHRSFSCHER